MESPLLHSPTPTWEAVGYQQCEGVSGPPAFGARQETQAGRTGSTSLGGETGRMWGSTSSQDTATLSDGQLILSVGPGWPALLIGHKKLEIQGTAWALFNLGLVEGKARRQECISESLQGSVAARVTNCHSLPRIEGFPECGNVSAKTTTVPGKLKQPRSPWVVPLDRGIQSIS